MPQVADRTLVAGIGNIFLSDDGFGCEVVRRLAASVVPDGVRVVDYGIRGMHLAYDLLTGWDQLVLVDALPDRGFPGRVETVEIGPEHRGGEGGAVAVVGQLDAHGMGPDAVLSSLEALGGRLPPTVLVGAQVSNVSDGIGLSAEVEAAVPAALHAIQSLLGGLQHDGPPAGRTQVR
jgi:hydrogenase maturation protease